MTLDDERVPWREMARRDREAAQAARYADWQEERMLESVETAEALWAGIMGRMTLERARESHPSRYIDTRCFAVDGDVDRP